MANHNSRRNPKDHPPFIINYSSLTHEECGVCRQILDVNDPRGHYNRCKAKRMYFVCGYCLETLLITYDILKIHVQKCGKLSAAELRDIRAFDHYLVLDDTPEDEGGVEIGNEHRLVAQQWLN